MIIPECGQYAGAIAGADGGTLADNYFVLEELVGISMVNVKRRTELPDYADLLESENTPEPFRRFTLCF